MQYTGSELVDHCSTAPNDCTMEMSLGGPDDLDLDGASNRVISVVLPHVSASDVADSYGFSVEIFNELSSSKVDPSDGSPVIETITLLDEAPVGTGEWVQAEVALWDANWVSSLGDT